MSTRHPVPYEVLEYEFPSMRYSSSNLFDDGRVSLKKANSLRMCWAFPRYTKDLPSWLTSQLPQPGIQRYSAFEVNTNTPGGSSQHSHAESCTTGRQGCLALPQNHRNILECYSVFGRRADEFNLGASERFPRVGLESASRVGHPGLAENPFFPNEPRLCFPLLRPAFF